MFHRYGHIEKIKFKVDDKVKRGQLIAENGTGNGQWPAHCHYDILTYKPARWTEYCIGKTKDWVKAHYADPRGNEKVVMPTFDHLGYGWLVDSQYAGGHAFHPGVDLNGKGSGNADLDDPIYSACDGVVVYAYSGTDKNSGWGDMIVIEQIEEVPQPEEKPNITEVPKQDEVVPILIKVEESIQNPPKLDTPSAYQELLDPKKRWIQLLNGLWNLIKLIFKF